MSEATGLSIVIEAKNALAVFTQPDHIESILQQVEKEVNSFVPDVSTKKGRDAIASLGLKVAKTKTYLDGLGKDLVTEYKEVPKKIDASRKTVRDRLDALKEKVLLPKLEFEAEQERLKLEAEAKKKAEQLAAEIEVAHEMALLMNDAFDRDAKAKSDEVERLRKAHEEFISQQAAEKAKREAEEKAKRDIEAAEQRERDAKLAQERAEQAAKDAAAKAECDAKELAERVEREKQEAIAAEKLKAQQEAERVQREAKQKEDARLAEEKRVADEAAARAANEAHRKTVGTAVVNGLIEHAGLTREQAIATLCAIKDSKIPHTNIHY
ncbi:cell envelope biogenesis protein TolA [Yersinia enterocolitica]|uniref:cell envelope biogenesis protein TolA n=1 Tax=Yersinia enterocolitica TaxID=630 RepID=UPI001CA4B325|nr:cell envelope biogenesis protein TolA [Yersinia enterocolitica]MBW5869517.1 cell envelope biogenesis protein TolA [Yersinia enterocolitica]